MHRPRRQSAALCLAAFACLLLPTLAFAQNRFEDPLGGKLLGPGGLLGKNAAAGVSVEASLVPSGEGEATLKLHVKLPEGSHTYPAQPTVSKGGPFKPTVFEASQTVGLSPVSELAADREPKVHVDSELDPPVTFEEFHDEVVFSQTYKLAADAKPDDVLIRGTLNLQVCDRVCRDVSKQIEVRLAEAGSDTAPAPGKPAGQPFVAEAQPVWGSNRSPAKWKFELSPTDAQPGEKVTLSATLNLDEQWYTYSQRDQKYAKPTTFTLKETPGLKDLDEGFEADHAPKPKQPEPGVEQEIFTGKVTWTRNFEVTDANYGVAGSARLQVCNKRQCLQAKTVPFYLGAVEKPEPPKTASEKPAGKGAGEDVQEIEKLTSQKLAERGFIPFLIAAVTFGFLSLLTPCVFPMVPITVSFFLKQSESKHHRPVWMASVYCLGIVLTFTALGLIMSALFGATSINDLANNPWLNLGIAALLIVFGMNMLGMFEIRVPSFLMTWSSRREGSGGIAGTLFMALTFTLVSFTCTFAFAGSLLVLAAQGDYYWPIVGMVAFSAAFSLPFFFLALFPSWLKKLPKSGGWLNTVKVTMGLVEVGAAFKFLSVADLVWNPTPVLFDNATVISAWIVISVVTGLYLLGLFRLSHDTPADSISPLRLMFAMSFLGLGGFLAMGAFAPEKPDGQLWANIEAFLPGQFEGGEGEIGPYTEHGELRFALDVEKAREYARKNNLPLLYDFTGVNCVNCRLMEKRMQKPKNRERLEKYVLVQLYTDSVPTITDKSRAAEILAKNDRLQEDWFGDVSLPSYVVVDPHGQRPLAHYVGLEQQEGEFAAFLDRGYQAWQQSAANRPDRLAQN